MKFIFILLLFVCNIFLKVTSQSCREYGQTCNDSPACCGGCCMLGVCKDTYVDCRVKESQCNEFPCAEDQECYMFTPENCDGCGPTPICRNSPPAPSETSLSTYASILPSSAGNYFQGRLATFMILLALYF